jgi:hypothetical protein
MDVFFFSNITPFSRPLHGVSDFEEYINRRMDDFLRNCKAAATTKVKQENSIQQK